jgi:nicotinamidase/pyrazinamidase
VKTLVVIDIQNDFLPGGALAVPRGEEVIEVANRVQEDFDLIVATQDWHPANHRSFASQHPGKQVGDQVELMGLPQILWPPHCIQGSTGAEFASDLETGCFARVFQKGTDPNIDSYSGFYDNGHRRSTGLAEYLRQMGVTEIYVLGLATDYCVRFTALDAVREGFATHVLSEGCRGVELASGDIDRAVQEMVEAGVWVTG